MILKQKTDAALESIEFSRCAAKIVALREFCYKDEYEKTVSEFSGGGY